MSHFYRLVQWNRQKRIYDVTIVFGILCYLAVFIGLSFWLNDQPDEMTILIRAFGTAAFLMLHIVLAIGPLCRLDRRYLPFLYNRRHLGVATFLVSCVHAALVIGQYHMLGDSNPIASIFTGMDQLDDVAAFPFQIKGFIALVILFVMAATSHDFWLANLTPPIWKALHMLVYFAYVMLVGHVVLGYLQAETGLLPTLAVGIGAFLIVSLHLAAGYREQFLDEDIMERATNDEGFIEACRVDELREKRGFIVTAGGERIAIFLYDGNISAISNVCQHQNGPLGEGRIIDGFVTCPWHGFQYDPATGASPPPFEEKVPTFNLKVVDDCVWLDPIPNLPGTFVAPAQVFSTDQTERDSEKESDES